MADLSAILKQLKAIYSPVNQSTVSGINSNYANQSAADKATYNNSLAQAKQTLSQVPAQFNAQRNSADITKNQAMSLLPSSLANSGAATDSGANYVASTNIGNTFQNTMGTIGTSQNTAKQTAQNAINTLNANESASQSKLNASKASDLASAYSTAASNLISNALSQYNTDASREESATEAANTLAENQREYNNTLAYKEATAANAATSTANKNYVSAVNTLKNALGNYTTSASTSTSTRRGTKTTTSTSTSKKFTNGDAAESYLNAIYSNPYLTDVQAQKYLSSVSYKVPYTHSVYNSKTGKMVNKTDLISLAHYDKILNNNKSKKVKTK